MQTLCNLQPLAGDATLRDAKLVGKDDDMSENPRLLLAFAVLIAATPMLSACYTARGAGQDLSAAGRSIEKSADRNTGYKP
jgi:predicted small secreted protein